MIDSTDAEITEALALALMALGNAHPGTEGASVIAALHASGFKIVPRRPTEVMIRAGSGGWLEGPKRDAAVQVWYAMLRASGPSAAQAGVTQEEERE